MKTALFALRFNELLDGGVTRHLPARGHLNTDSSVRRTMTKLLPNTVDEQLDSTTTLADINVKFFFVHEQLCPI
jgi:hypothetical protein